jgi:hypothetical protein
MKSIAYRKSYEALIEAKGNYVANRPDVPHRYVHTARKEGKQQCALKDTELTQFYTVITAIRKN